MRIGTAMRLGGAAIVAGAALAIGGCTPRGDRSGPFAADTEFLVSMLRPGATRLDVASEAVRQVREAGGALKGSYDGTRLLVAADAHAHGTPVLGDPAVDVRGDGSATFDEIRQVVRGFDADASGTVDHREYEVLRVAVGIRWIPAP